MPKTKISEFSATPANNTDIDSINIAEGCAPSGINDAIRELMAQLKDFQTGAVGDSFNGPVGTTTAAAGAFTTLAASSTVTLSGGTANGVAYLNGSKVVTSGSALTFDGTNLANTGNITAGTTGSGANLVAYASTYTSNGMVRLFGTDGNNKVEFGAASATTAFLTARAGVSMIFGANDAEGMRLTSTGLGIGTSSPAVNLNVYKNTYGEVARFEATSLVGYLTVKNGAVTNILGSDSNAGISWVGSSTNHPLILRTNDITRATIDTSGNLGIKCTPSTFNASGYGTVEFGSSGGSAIMGNANDTYFISNAYYNSAFYYKISAAAGNYNINNGVHKWSVAPSGTAGNAITFTQAMTLDASGNLGLGTTSPTVKLDIAGSGNVSSRARFSKTAAGTLQLGADRDVSACPYIGSESNSAFAFITHDTERCRIDSSGNLLVGTTSSTFLADSGGFIVYPTTTGETNIVVKHDTGTGSGATYASFTYATSSIGSITQNGTTAVAYNTSSDYRLKNTIAPMTGALAKVALLKPCTYKWNADGSDGEGFIAHELAEVVPQCVTGEKDAVDAEGNPKYQGIDTSFLVATLTAAIQELKAEFDAYKASHP